MNKLKKLLVRWELLLILVIVIEFMVFGSLNPKFLNIKRLFSGLNQFIPVCIISLFVTFVMITGGIDIHSRFDRWTHEHHGGCAVERCGFEHFLWLAS